MEMCRICRNEHVCMLSTLVRINLLPYLIHVHRKCTRPVIRSKILCLFSWEITKQTDARELQSNINVVWYRMHLFIFINKTDRECRLWLFPITNWLTIRPLYPLSSSLYKDQIKIIFCSTIPTCYNLEPNAIFLGLLLVQPIRWTGSTEVIHSKTKYALLHIGLKSL